MQLNLKGFLVSALMRKKTRNQNQTRVQEFLPEYYGNSSSLNIK